MGSFHSQLGGVKYTCVRRVISKIKTRENEYSLQNLIYVKLCFSKHKFKQFKIHNIFTWEIVSYLFNSNRKHIKSRQASAVSFSSDMERMLELELMGGDSTPLGLPAESSSSASAVAPVINTDPLLHQALSVKPARGDRKLVVARKPAMAKGKAAKRQVCAV